MEFSYFCQPPKRYTFEQPKLRSWVESWCKGKVLNLFAGRTKLSVDEYRVDSNPTMKPDWCGDAIEFLKTTRERFDTVILDPPYSFRKAIEKYQGHWIGNLRKLKESLMKVLMPNARVISLGYDSVGMSRSWGFQKIAICLVCHGGVSKDTIALVEERLLNASHTQ